MDGAADAAVAAAAAAGREDDAEDDDDGDSRSTTAPPRSSAPGGKATAISSGGGGGGTPRGAGAADAPWSLLTLLLSLPPDAVALYPCWSDDDDDVFDAPFKTLISTSLFLVVVTPK